MFILKKYALINNLDFIQLKFLILPVKKQVLRKVLKKTYSWLKNLKKEIDI